MEYLQEWRILIDGEFVPSIEADRLVAWARQEIPEVLQEWLDSNAVRFTAQTMNSMLRSERQIAIQRASARRFALAAESGDRETLGMFKLMYSVDENNTRRKVADMTGRDHVYVADRYAITGNRVLLLAEFHRAIARRVGENRTGDVMDEAEYERLVGSIVGGSSVGVPTAFASVT